MIGSDDVREALSEAIGKGSGASRYQADLLAEQMLPHMAEFMARYYLEAALDKTGER